MAIDSKDLIGGELRRLAPDVGFPSAFAPDSGYVRIQSIDASSGLTTLLSLIGKFSIDILQIASLASEEIVDIKLTIDGVPVWDITYEVPGTVLKLLGENGSAYYPIVCKESFLLEFKTTTDTDIWFDYLVRPIL